VVVVVERISELPRDGFDALVLDSERAGLSFVRRLADEWAEGQNRFDRLGEALFAALTSGRMIGVCGLNVDPYTAAPRVGRVRHLYVCAAQRHLGAGAQLVRTVIAAARDPFDTLRLSTQNPAAARLYESFGFEPSTGAVDCTHVLALR
jgi:GNAT superfamily N-acetyltransferase